MKLLYLVYVILFSLVNSKTEVYNAISSRVPIRQTSPNIPGNSVKDLFNDMQLYPSNKEVAAMIQVARQVSRRNGAPNNSYLTFGEFSFFAREMQKNKPNQKAPSNKTEKCINKCEVFLGGSCNPTTWRTDFAIPELTQHGISYYNPQVQMWAPELVAQEHHAKQSASLLFFVVDSQTRSVSGMIEVAYLVAARRCVVLVAYPYKENQSIMDEPITYREYVDLANAQTSLLALVKSQGVTVHGNLTSALQSTVNILRNACSKKGMTADDQVAHKLCKLRETFDYFDKNGKGEINLQDVLDAYRRLTNKSLDMRSANNYLSTNDDANIKRISFEQFCALVAEFSPNGCDLFTSDGRRIDNTYYWSIALLKTRHLLKLYVTKPVTDIIDWLSNLVKNGTTTMNNNVQNESYDKYIFLGGSCKSKLPWREHVMSILNMEGVKYYNPVIREGECESSIASLNGSVYNETCICDRNVFQWKEEMEKSTVLMFYITKDTRSLSTMILAAHYIGLRRNVVLCIEQLPHEELYIDNEKLTKQAIKDYNRGRVYLQDLAKRKDVPVFDNIKDSIQCAIERFKNTR